MGTWHQKNRVALAVGALFGAVAGIVLAYFAYAIAYGADRTTNFSNWFRYGYWNDQAVFLWIGVGIVLGLLWVATRSLSNSN